MFPLLSLAKHSVALGQDTAFNAVPPSIEMVVQDGVVLVGLVEVRTWPALFTATQRLVLGQETLFKPAALMPVGPFQTKAPPEAAAVPVPKTASNPDHASTHNAVSNQERTRLPPRTMLSTHPRPLGLLRRNGHSGVADRGPRSRAMTKPAQRGPLRHGGTRVRALVPSWRIGGGCTFCESSVEQGSNSFGAAASAAEW